MNIVETLPKTLAQIEAEKGKITLKAVYKNAGAFTVCPVKDPNRPGFYLGVEKLSDEEKRKREYYVEAEGMKIRLKDGHSFDLSKIVDRLNWHWVKYISEIAMSFEEAQMSSYETRMYVKIEEVESQKTVSRITLKIKALNLVMDDEPLNYSARTRLLGMDMRGQTSIAQKEWLLEMSERDPQKVINVYESDTVGIRLLVLNALDKGIIDYDQNIYSYNTKTLGMNEDAVVDFLTRSVNRPISELIESELKTITGPELTEKVAERPTQRATMTQQELQKDAELGDIEVVEPEDSPVQARPRGGYKN